MQPETAFDEQLGFTYQPYGQRLITRVIPLSDEPASIRLSANVDYGQRGQVVLTRLDEAQLLINLVERDSAVRSAPRGELLDLGFVADGLADPRPIINPTLKPSVGFY